VITIPSPKNWGETDTIGTYPAGADVIIFPKRRIPEGTDEIKISSKEYPERGGMTGIPSENYREDRK
jgi:hypothetical protein